MLILNGGNLNNLKIIAIFAEIIENYYANIIQRRN